MTNQNFLVTKSTIVLVCMACFLMTFKTLYAQDIEPRRWTPMPLGVHVLGLGYGYQAGTLYFDPTLQIENASVDVNLIGLQYFQPFKLGNKLARLDVKIPYLSAHWDGLLAGNPESISRHGFADPILRMSLNLIGPDAFDSKGIKEYYAANPVNTIFGVSLAVTFPFGQYYSDKLLNLGQNRFVFRPQMGMVHNWGLWSYELTTSVYIFTNNNNFYNNQTRRQDPLFAVQTHLIRQFKNRMWTSISAGYGVAGESSINNIEKKDNRSDILGEVALGFPLFKKQAVKVTYLRTQTFNDIGSDTNTFAMGWSLVF
ncbi:transporter [Formosa sp. PL04]|uniref:transporter n=1 Tax=Formosa sp. PL04 TaxID=3081755 RepID=UPI0029825594|nr:transporter [Formosa sp. PL04]MDW5289136.1 transporter [Formosa sp. PL04]